MRDCAEIVDEQISAYERGDLAGFLATYEDDAICVELPSGRVIAQGLGEISTIWGRLFERGRRKVEIGQRIIHGRFVTDHEHVTGPDGRTRASTVAIYHLGPSAIRRVWFLQEPDGPA